MNTIKLFNRNFQYLIDHNYYTGVSTCKTHDSESRGQQEAVVCNE